MKKPELFAAIAILVDDYMKSKAKNFSMVEIGELCNILSSVLSSVMYTGFKMAGKEADAIKIKQQITYQLDQIIEEHIPEIRNE